MTTPAQLGKYQITEVLGTGAMGVVYKGFDPGIRRIVAIKTIRRELIAGDRPGVMMLKRFRNEAQAAGRLSHPGIVAVYDYGEDAEVAYIAMEYVEGNSLREYFARGSRFSERDAVSIMSQLLEALAHAHERRVWHRDIKPGNLIIMMNGRVKVADFGIARIEASDLTQTGAVLGSPGYMAPEQYAAAAIDHRADVFAAGVVFYQLLTGSRPFVGTAEQLAYAICHTEPARPSIADPGKGWERYDALIAKALAKRPEDRFQTAEAFRAALLEAHARPAAAAVSEETIITEILRPAAAMEPTVPSGSRAAQPAPSAKPPKRWGWAVGAGLVAVLAAVGVAWVSRKEAPPSPPPQPVAAAPAAPASRPQSGEEVVFWESVRSSTNRAELEAYLAKYPEGTFAPLARARLDALAAADAKRAAESQPIPAAPTPAPARSYAGNWKGMFACDTFEGDQSFAGRPVNVSVQGDAFVLERGTREQPGWFSLRGTPDASGNLQLLGSGISGIAAYRGKPYAATDTGRLEGDRYEGRGLFGRRNCTISMARAGS